MELKATSLLLLICIAIIILSAEGDTSAIPTCCLTVSKKLPWAMLRKVTKYDIQSRSGRCEIDALILYIGKRKVCAHPKVKKALQKAKKKFRKNHKPKKG
ncbi:C-C motif chemokine 27a [Pseudorasbora parva]|uniref:C-C motif chemokine 27a n=1 Tax=Pseudorasbora parva TaxID=51549 RepID=UPI00351F2B34